MSGELHHLAAAYALDALEEPERSAFEAHYPTCEICRVEVAEFRETAGALAAAAATTPPAELKARVLGEVARTRQLSPGTEETGRRRSTVRSAFLAAAAVVLLAVGAVLVVGLRGASTVEDVLAAPDAVVTTLSATPDGRGGTFQVVWSAERGQVAVIANDLPDPGPDRGYELWAIDRDVPVPTGVLTPDDGSLRDASDVAVRPTAWGVTIEPVGGSSAPTTPVLFFGEV